MSDPEDDKTFLIAAQKKAVANQRIEINRLQRDLAACDEAGKRIGAALTSAAILINALLDELIHSSRAADRPLPLQLIAAKGSFDLQIQRLFKTMEPKTKEDQKP